MRQPRTWTWVGGGLLLGLLLLGAGMFGGVLAWRSLQLQLVAAAPTPTKSTTTNTATPVPPTPSPVPTPTALSAAPQPAPFAGAPNVRVSAVRFSAHSEAALAQNPRNPDNLVGASKMFTDNANYVFRIGTYATFDGGATWIDNGHLSGLERFEVTSDPTVVFDRAGTAYVEVLAANRQQEPTSSLFLYKSTDGGRTWSQPTLVTDDARGFNDKQWLAVDTSGGVYDGALYTVWVQIVDETYRILFAHSRDGGAAWSEPQVLAADEQIARQGPVVVVDASGSVAVIWSNLSRGYFESTVSADGGRSFAAPRRGLPFRSVKQLKGNLRRGFVLGALAADPRKPDTLYLVCDDGRHGHADILFSRSFDGGATWQQPVVIAGRPVNDQFQPWVAANWRGEIFVQWFDRRDDPNNLLVHTYAARSRDGGQTWSELRITDVASDPTVGLPMANKVGFYGDYQALVADTGRVHFFWNETRDGAQAIYSAAVDQERWGQPYHVPPAELIEPHGQSRREADE